MTNNLLIIYLFIYLFFSVPSRKETVSLTCGYYFIGLCVLAYTINIAICFTFLF